MAVEDKGDDCPEGTPICTRVRADDSAGNLRRQLGVNAKSKPGKPGLTYSLPAARGALVLIPGHFDHGPAKSRAREQSLRRLVLLGGR